MEFDPGIVGAEAPVDRDARRVAPGFVGRDGAFQGVGVGVSARNSRRMLAKNKQRTLSVSDGLCLVPITVQSSRIFTR